MSFRFLHSADWQMGARFKQFGAKAAELRAARLETLQKSLIRAREKTVDAFLIAGDLFEDNQVDDKLVGEVVDLFAAYPEIPIYILPGNHDPYTGPGSVWHRRAFQTSPSNVHVLSSAGVTDLGGGAYLLASPLHQKLSTIDPSLKLVELAAGLPGDSIKVGLTHGALAIEGMHQPNDFPISLNAASRAGLDYLGIGHWHNWLADSDGGRLVMPGTPEPDQFANERSGNVALVEISGLGQKPRVESLPVATLTWKSCQFDFLNAEASQASLDQILAQLTDIAAKTVLRVTLNGPVTTEAKDKLLEYLQPKMNGFLVHQIVDHSQLVLSSTEVQDLKIRHPILMQVLADIDRLETLATGSLSGSLQNGMLEAGGDSGVLTLLEIKELLGQSKIELEKLSPEFFIQLRQQLFQTLRGVAV